MTQATQSGALSGGFVMRHREALRRRVGAENFESVLAALEPAAREAIVAARADSWVPVAYVEALFARAASAIGCAPSDLHTEIATQISDAVVRTVWRIVLGFSSDALLASRAPVFYAKSWNRGTLTVKLVGRGRAEGVLEGWPDAPDFTVRAVRIALGVVLRAAGRQQVEVISERHPRGPRWHMRWQV